MRKVPPVAHVLEFENHSSRAKSELKILLMIGITSVFHVAVS